MHPNQVPEWRRELLERAAEAFGAAAEPAQPGVNLKVLQDKIGQRTREKDFLEGLLTKAALLSAKRLSIATVTFGTVLREIIPIEAAISTLGAIWIAISLRLARLT